MKVEELEQLITNYKNGNKSTIDEILKDFYPFIINRCKLVYINGLTFDDIVQECNMALLKSIDKYKINSNKFYGYGKMVVTNRIKELIRSNCKHNLTSPIDYIEITEDNTFDTTNDKIDLLGAIGKLDQLEQQLIKEYFFKDKSIISISNNDNVLAKKNYKNLDRALTKLKALLK